MASKHRVMRPGARQSKGRANLLSHRAARKFPRAARRQTGKERSKAARP